MFFYESDLPTGEKDRGAAAWFQQEVLPLEPQLRGWLRQRFRSIQDTDDLIQEALLRVWRASAALPPRQPKAFLFCVARNLALEQIRRRHCSPFSSSFEARALMVADNAPHLPEGLAQCEDLSVLRRAIAALPPGCRAVTQLKIEQELSTEEISRRLGITPTSVFNHLSSARKHCRAYFEAHGDNLALPHRQPARPAKNRFARAFPLRPEQTKVAA